LTAEAYVKTTTKLNNIQVLRAFAATAVVLFHAGFAFPFMRPFGSFGVDVFFVISGYIMARILDPQSDSSSDFFFRRRILRIAPPYWCFTILLYLVALRVPQLMGSTRASLIELIKSLLFIPFTKGSGLIQPLLFIGWSLNYEMFFYLALAIGLLFHKRKGIWIGAGIVLSVIIFCQIALATFAPQSTFAQFYGRDVSLEFLLGILSYYLCRAISDQRARSLRWPALLICLASAALLIAEQGIIPRALVPFGFSRVPTLGVLSFLLITSASLLSQGNWDTKLSSLVLLGDASYILYLIHPYCEYSIDRMLGARHHWLKCNTASGAVVAVGLSITLAILIHLYCERPTVRFLNRNFGGKRKSVEFAPS
jgi:exopolysaccharide production protein ExoZ